MAPVTVSECDEFCCARGPRRTKEEDEARKERRKVSYGNAVRLLHFAEKAALDDDAGQAKALVEIANAWDSIGY